MKHDQSKLIRTQIERTEEGEHSSPLFLTSSFCFDEAESMRAAFADESDDNIYSRFSNPNVQEFVDRLAVLEHAEAGFATASGMSAVFGSFMALLKKGDHLLSCNAIFGSTHNVVSKYLPKYGIEYSYVSAGATAAEWEAAIQPNTKMIYLESPTNPGLEVLDIAMISAIAKKHHVILNVDNCFATPIGQTPIDLGADLVVHSATKWIDGQGRVLGGAVVGRKDLIHEIYLFCRSTGPALSPFNAWVLLKSLETMEMRVERMNSNAQEIAEYLDSHENINWVRYPGIGSHPQFKIARSQMSGGGTTISFEIKGDQKRTFEIMNKLHVIDISNNLGDSKSLITHPASTTHRRLSPEVRAEMGITQSVLRLSVGLEHPSDLLRDLDQALTS